MRQHDRAKKVDNLCGGDTKTAAPLMQVESKKEKHFLVAEQEIKAPPFSLCIVSFCLISHETPAQRHGYPAGLQAVDARHSQGPLSSTDTF